MKREHFNYLRTSRKIYYSLYTFRFFCKKDLKEKKTTQNRCPIKKRLFLTEVGNGESCKTFRVENLYECGKPSVTHHLDQRFAWLISSWLFDIDYVVQDEKVMIVDHLLDVIMEGTPHSDGLHQAIEAKRRL